MGWQDRDYARGSTGRYWLGTGRNRLFGGSIVSTLIAINVGVYLLAMFVPSLGVWIYGLGMMEARAVLNGQVWRLVTAQYLHDPGGVWHLAINMLVLHFLGRPLERLWSAKRFFVVYTLCGLAGNVFYTVLGGAGWIDPRMPAVGASGCIYGLLGIVAVLFPHATVYVYFLFPIKIRTAAFIFAGIALLTVLQRGANYGGEACHLAGLAFGVWWAMQGDRWWDRARRRFPLRRRRRSGAAHSWPAGPGGGFSEDLAERRADEQEIDRILRKVYDKGIMSLSEPEKRLLQDATDRQRRREEEAGRVDRL